MKNAVFIMLIAMSLIPSGDSAGKLLSSYHNVSPIFVAWSRFVVGALVLLPFVSLQWMKLFRDWRIWFRALTLCIGITCIQMGLKTEPVANIFAAFFIGPLISYLLAVIFLKEPATLLRSLLVVIGFIGVLIVVRPSADMSKGILWAVAAGTLYGVFLTQSRWLAHVAPPLAMTFSQLVIPSLLMIPIGLTQMPQFTAPVTALTVASGLCSMGGNLLLLFAYRLTEATKIAPLVYFQLLAAVGLGWAIFSDLPDIWTWAGLAVIITSGVMSTRLR